MASYQNLLPGDPAPNFTQRTFINPQFTFDTAAGRYLVLCFFGTTSDSHSAAAFRAVKERPDLFNDDFCSFFGVTVDQADDDGTRLSNSPGYRFFLDMDQSVSRKYGAANLDADATLSLEELRRVWVVIDPTMRVLHLIPFKSDHSDIAEFLTFMESLPLPHKFAGFEIQAPIIVLPNVFERELCDRLIGLYEAHGGTETGYMEDRDGKTVGVLDHKRKSRSDYQIEDGDLISQLQARFRRRVIPEIEKIHQFHATRMERYIVSCYAAEDGGHFTAHRDNTTKGTAHRRFAVSINLNDDFDGGEVGFPEYGPRRFKAPTGGAVVFSCSLLHSVSKVTRGHRYAFLPFLYDDDAARLRQENNQFLGEDVESYRRSTTQEAASSQEEASPTAT